MGKKQREAAAEKLAAIPEGVPRVILATGSYIRIPVENGRDTDSDGFGVAKPAPQEFGESRHLR